MRSDLVDIDIHVHARTDRAVLVSTGGERGTAVWVPLSRAEIEPHQTAQRVYVLTLPEDLAIEKELV